MKKAYKVLRGKDIEEVSQEVRRLIAEGWECEGGMSALCVMDKYENFQWEVAQTLTLNLEKNPWFVRLWYYWRDKTNVYK